MAICRDPDSISRLIHKVHQLPSDKPVAGRQPGYNNFDTQENHWLGWLGEDPPGPGTYARKTGKNRDAQYVYNHIVEPKMLLWLIEAAGVTPDLINAAKRASNEVPKMQGKSASIRKHVPWSEVAIALWGSDGAAV